MNVKQSTSMKRREFVKVTTVASTGLALASPLSFANSPQVDETNLVGDTHLHTWIEIFPDNRIELTVIKADLGQGIGTAWAQILSEELDADWENVKVVFRGEEAPYLNPRPGYFPATFGSTSVRYWYKLLLQIAASAKAMLKQAAANQWGVDPRLVIAHDSKVFNLLTRESLTYGDLVDAAKQLSVPESPPLKNPFFFSKIGRSIPSQDTEKKVNGTLTYGIDMQVDGMVYAAIRQAPQFGAVLDNVESLFAYLKPGQTLVPLENGVMVTGTSWWEAEQTLNAMPITFKETATSLAQDSESIRAELLENLNKPGIPMFEQGDTEAGFAAAEKIVSATYEVPFLSHSSLEPMSCTAWAKNGKITIWVSTQSSQLLKVTLAGILSIPPTAITVNVIPSGGSFGRRVANDFVIQAVFASLATGKPVNLLWSRSEDTQHDQYRPSYAARMKAGLNGQEVLAWTGKNTGQAVINNPNLPFDPFAAEGFAEPDYEIENVKSETVRHESIVPTGFWRSVGLSHNSFFIESFIDELAQASNADPFRFRKRMLRDQPRKVRVLDKLALMTKLQFPKLKGAAHGLSIVSGFDSIVGTVVEVKSFSGKIKVTRIWCVVDCGRVINPDGAKAQIEGGLIFGLSACLYSEITLKEGRVEQVNFSDNPVVKMRDAPELHVTLLSSREAPGGIGEAGVPGVAPAVCNAVSRLTGQRIRRLPIATEEKVTLY